LLAGNLASCAEDALGRDALSAEWPLALDGATPEMPAAAKSATSAWIETTFTVLFTATAVLFVSLVAVMSGLV
jgi:hypothetical protein